MQNGFHSSIACIYRIEIQIHVTLSSSADGNSVIVEPAYGILPPGLISLSVQKDKSLRGHIQDTDLGDYFKEESIAMSYDFLTNYLRIPTEKLAVTVFEGDDAVPPDVDAECIWMEQGLRKEQIFRYGRDENWWGPAGQTDRAMWAGYGNFLRHGISQMRFRLWACL